MRPLCDFSIEVKRKIVGLNKRRQHCSACDIILDDYGYRPSPETCPGGMALLAEFALLKFKFLLFAEEALPYCN